MRESRIAAANKVATELFETERALDQLLSCAARLSAALPEARFKANLSGVMGQSALLSSAQLIAAVVEARGIAVTLHGQLDELKTDIGLRTLSMGGGMYKGMADEGQLDSDAVVPMRASRAA